MQQTGSHFAADRCVVGGVVVIGYIDSLQSVWHALDWYGLCLGQNCVVRVNLRLICGEGETACHLTGAARRKTWTKSGGS